MVIIPNKEVLQNPIGNFSLLGRRRMDLKVGVCDGEDLGKVKDIVLNAAGDIAGLSTNDKTTFFYAEFAYSSINFSLRIWVASPQQPDFLRIRSEAIQKIKKAFDESGITILFPIRTLNFGVKGGRPPSGMSLSFSGQNGHRNGEAESKKVDG
jgi:small conductance mechanosensitive channel